MTRRGGVTSSSADAGLPDRSGVELMPGLRAQYGLRGIALSGRTEAADLKAARDAGSERFPASRWSSKS